ncbi:MAG: metal ABC transporter ATP-binding protein [Chlamydiae bacterium]|nr:metal ABC transporter ATP-binding protein [Chlamydiota bacterium]
MNKKAISAVEVSQLTVNYDLTPVLWDINFSIPQGVLVGIIGPNGAGKSTLLKAMLNMVPTLSGKVLFAGASYRKSKGKIAYVPQRSAVDWDFPITVLEVVMMGLYAKKGLFSFINRKDKKAALEVLEKVGMESYAHRQIAQLSGGQQQRVFLARAILQDAEVYFMDEPFAGVDLSTEQSIMLLLQELKSRGKTLLIVHHDLDSVPSYFDWLVMLNISLLSSGSIDTVFNQENINRTFGQGAFLIDEAAKLSLKRQFGIK